MNKAVSIGLFFLICSIADLFAQVYEHTFIIDGHQVIFRIKTTVPEKEFDSLMNEYGMPSVSVDSLIKIESKRAEISGWRVKQIENDIIELYKPLYELSGSMEREMLINYTKQDHVHFDFSVLDVVYGVNNFRRQSVFTSRNSNSTTFLLRNYENARNVVLSGSFNGWSTTHTRMSRTVNGWVANVPLKPGKYHYKFIVDGHWMDDPDNKQRERNEVGTFNSVFYKYNYSFDLEGYSNASKVIVAGSFNDWNERELKMEKVNGVWHLPLYLKEGTHAYKFIVDGEWITDPENPVARPDGSGNVNSFIAIGDTVHFELNGYQNANEVYLSGNFNAWNPNELSMEKRGNRWVMPYVLAPGNYEYKFIVDGRWMPDPDNPHTQGSGDYVNSFISIEPNHTFTLEGYEHADVVRLSGNFNNWDENGYTLARKNDKWQIELYLKPGKYIYKFIVDGEYILDPSNPYWEQNEFGTGNSVLWIEPFVTKN